MKQLVLENDRGKKGVGDSEVQKEIYAFGKELVGSKIVALIGGRGQPALGTSCCPRGMSAVGVRHRPKKRKPQQRSTGARARGGKDEDASALFDI